MGLVDWHSHVWLPDHLGQEWGRDLDGKYGAPPSQLGRPEEHLRALEEAGVAHSVVIALTSLLFGLCIPNEFVADYVKTDPRLIGIASVDPNDPAAPQRLESALTELGLVGVKLSPPYQDFHPHSAAAFNVYEVAAHFGAVVIFHQGAVSMSRGVLDAAQPVLLDKVARSFPELRIIVAHMGQPWVGETLALMRKHEYVFGDVSARCSRPSQLRAILEGALDFGVVDKILFGSDFPVYRPGDHVKQLLVINDNSPGRQIPESVLKGIAFERPLSLLGLPRVAFA